MKQSGNWKKWLCVGVMALTGATVITGCGGNPQENLKPVEVKPGNPAYPQQSDPSRDPNWKSRQPAPAPRPFSGGATGGPGGAPTAGATGMP